MRDALCVRRRDRIGERNRDRQQLGERQAAFGNRQRERPALDQLHHEEPDRARLLDRIDRDDVRMIQRGGGARFTLEAAEPIGIGGEGRRQDLDRDVTAEAPVAGAVHLAHAAGAEQRHDLVGPKRRAGGQSHLMVPEGSRSLYPTVGRA